ncbi:condensation domain-containing protein, partial [Burkholderia ubonensis]
MTPTEAVSPERSEAGSDAAPPPTPGLAEKRAELRRLLERRAPERRAPLSPAQERLWFLEQLQGSTGAYHLQVVLDFGQTLSIEALEGALNAIVARHEALR